MNALRLIQKPTNEREKVEDFFDNANDIRYGTFGGIFVCPTASLLEGSS